MPKEFSAFMKRRDYGYFTRRSGNYVDSSEESDLPRNSFPTAEHAASGLPGNHTGRGLDRPLTIRCEPDRSRSVEVGRVSVEAGYARQIVHRQIRASTWRAHGGSVDTALATQ